LLALDAIISFAGEVSSIGRADYTIWYAIGYIILTLPQELYRLFPMAALLGGMLGLGVLASNSELVAIRAAGVSVRRVLLAVLKAALLLSVAVTFIGEVIAPPAIQYAKFKRLRAISAEISMNTDFGLWARDGNTYIHVRRVSDDGRLFGINLYMFNDKHGLEQTISAANARFDGKKWKLNKVRQSTIDEQGIVTKHMKSLQWDTLLNPSLVNVVAVTPENLAIWRLYSYIEYLHSNGLDASHYELSFWNKVIAPFSMAVMVILAVPFVFGSLRSSSIGQRIVLGFLIGLIFFIVDRLVGQVGIVYRIYPAVAASLPTVVVLIIALALLRRVR
jgi:lipopolysaccharide export system permease protein